MGISRTATLPQSRHSTRCIVALGIDRLQMMVIPDPDVELASPAVERPDTYPQVGATRLDHVLPGAVFLQMRPEDGLDGEMVLEFQDSLGWRVVCHLRSFGSSFYYTPG